MKLTNQEIDRKCAEKIMGWEMEKDWHGEYWTEGNGILARPTIYESYCSHWHPSESLDQAWQVKQRIQEVHPEYSLEMYHKTGDKCHAKFVENFYRTRGEGWDDSPSRAICLACIQAWEGK